MIKFAENEKHPLASYWAGYVFYCPDDDTMLLEKRSGIMHHPHQWDIPGGRNEIGDKSIQDTAKREITEELGGFPEHYQVVESDDNERPGKDYYTWIAIISKEEKDKWRAKIRFDEESSDISWFNPDELPRVNKPNLMSVLERLEKYRKRIKTASLIKYASQTIPARFEWKYFISPSMAVEIKKFAQPFISADEHGANYKIKNIYLDNDNLKLYSDHIIEPDRYKLRIRFYDKGDAFFEIKRKAGGNIMKQRMIVPALEYEMVVGEKKIPWFEKASTLRAYPFVVINYDREAYNCPGGRITFDTNIKYATADYGYGRNQIANNRLEPIESVLMELKFNESMPIFMKTLSYKFDLNRGPFSKYFESVSEIIG